MNCLISRRFGVALIFSLIAFTLNVRLAIACDQVGTVGQEDKPDTIIIHKITIVGNKITNDRIILRELNFKEHDAFSLHQLSSILIVSKQNIFNTRLFNFVTINTTRAPDPRLLDVNIALVERWYIWPIPYLEISDRNFNVWWETRDFSRLTYGIDFTFSNVRGRNETLTILTHFGYNQKFGFTYKIPYINNKQTFGTGFGAFIDLNHELPVYTQKNKPVYIRSNSIYLKKSVSGYAELYVRPDFFNVHTMRITYTHNQFDSTILKIPGYIISGKYPQQIVSFTYLYKSDHRDVQYYPLKGYCIEVELNHSVPYETARNSYFRTNLRVYLQLPKRFYWAMGLTGKLSFETYQPYYLQRGLGYGRDFVRGYEYYVIDGQHFALLKNNLKFALIPQKVKKIGFIQTTKFNTIPLALYMNAFIDMGFVYHYPENLPGGFEAGNTLENNFLIGYGLGLDFTTYYDVVIRVEGAMNRLLQPGIYLHFIAPI